MTSTKLCIQHKYTTEQERATYAATKFVGVKVNDDPPVLAGYHFPYTVGRRVFDSNAMANWMTMLRANPQSLADWWWERIMWDILRAPHALWECVNEFTPPDNAAEYAQFEIACMKYAESIGVKLVIGNFGTGNPANFTWWAGYRPALDYARAHGHKFGYHGYYGIVNGQPAKWEYNLDRLEKVRAMYPGILDGIDVFLTELGVDAVEDINTPGWKTCLSKEQYLAQLTGFVNDLLNNRPYIKAAFIYHRADGDNFDVAPLIGELCQFVNASNAGLPSQPPVEPPPAFGYPYTGKLTAALNLRLGTSSTAEPHLLLPIGTTVKVTGKVGDRVIVEASVLESGVKRV